MAAAEPEVAPGLDDADDFDFALGVVGHNVYAAQSEHLEQVPASLAVAVAVVVEAARPAVVVAVEALAY